MEALLQPPIITLAAEHSVNYVDRMRRPSMNGWIHIAKVPLIGRNLSVGVEVLAAQHQAELLFGETGIHQSECGGVKGQIPGRIPGVFPFVGHGDDITVVHVMPLLIPEALGVLIAQWINAALLEPRRDVVVVELFGPQHPCHGLSKDELLIGAQAGWHHTGVKRVTFLLSALQDLIKALSGLTGLYFGC